MFILFIIINSNGDCVATISSSQDSEAMESWGLASNHGFAIYRVKEVDGLKLVMIKNPWGNEKVWKGKYGPDDACWKNESFKRVFLLFYLLFFFFFYFFFFFIFFIISLLDMIQVGKKEEFL